MERHPILEQKFNKLMEIARDAAKVIVEIAEYVTNEVKKDVKFDPFMEAHYMTLWCYRNLAVMFSKMVSDLSSTEMEMFGGLVYETGGNGREAVGPEARPGGGNGNDD